MTLSAKFSTPSGDRIEITRDGTVSSIEASPQNRDYRDLIAGGVHILAYEPPALAQIKETLRNHVDVAAELVRLKYITPGVGQAMTYQEKKDQAVAVVAMGEAASNTLANHGAAEFPTLSASVPIEAPSLYAAAQLVIARYEAWTGLSRTIELTRLNGKKAISDASNAADAKAAYEAIAWTV
jgi:hypothetical protein